MACMAAAVVLTVIYVYVLSPPRPIPFFPNPRARLAANTDGWCHHSGVCKRENDSRNLLPPPEKDQAFEDLTDNENKGIFSFSSFFGGDGLIRSLW